jgi:SAM-dependent methyltransferase
MDESCSGERYLEPYRDAVKRFGPGFQATLWSSREAQQLRFDVMIDVAQRGSMCLKGLEGCTILDAGCGAGDFAQCLIERGVNFTRYVGVDAVTEMIDLARQKNLARCEFIVGDLLGDQSLLTNVKPDFVCISGTLNTMDEEHARILVKAAFDAATQGVLFNFLSNRPDEQWHDKDLGPARRFDTIRWLDWTLHLTPRVRFTQDYLDGHDATIMMRHE